MRLASTLWLWTLVALTLPIGYLLGVVLLGVCWPFDRHRRLPHLFVTAWCHAYLRLWPGWRVTVTGRQHLPPGPCVLIANHQSMSDILALMGLRYAFKFVSKASLFRIPFIGWMMRRLHYVALERGKLQSMQDMVEQCDALLDAGQAVLIFPEATYATGPTRLPFKRGAFRLALKHQVPLVPIVLRGTSELVHEDGPWFEPWARVSVEVLEPVTPPPLDGDDEGWARELERRYEGWLGQPFPRRSSPGTSGPQP